MRQRKEKERRVCGKDEEGRDSKAIMRGKEQGRWGT
jgi:hypothetical protein